MAEDITIKKVDTIKNFSGVAHIEIPALNSGSMEWVPESARRTKVKKITANGTYLAESDSTDGYTAVLVDVPTTKVKGKKDGQDTIAMVDELGNIIYIPAN